MNTIVVDGREVTPSKIVCVGRNYLDHIAELHSEIPDEPVIFIKPNSALTNVLSSYHQEQLHYEGELSFLYENGRFAAVGFGLDITKRGLQRALRSKGLPWERAKAFDGSALFSRFVEIAEIGEDLGLELAVNDRVCQVGSVGLMIYKPADILAHLKEFMSLEDGDIIMTGTPRGVGPINPGDLYRGRIVEHGSCLTQSEWTAA